MSTRRQCLLAIGGAAALGGCATSRWDEPLTDGTVVSLVLTRSAAAATPTRIVNLNAPGAVATGMGSGTAAGLGIGLACGPFAPMCLALTLPLGAVAGTLTGAAVASASDLPEPSAAQVRERWTRARTARDPLADLSDALTERARAHWTLAAEGSSATIHVELLDIQLTSTREQQIGFMLRAEVGVRPGAGRTRVTPKPQVIEVAVPTVPLAQWLDDADAVFDAKWRSASQQLASQIVAALVAP